MLHRMTWMVQGAIVVRMKKQTFWSKRLTLVSFGTSLEFGMTLWYVFHKVGFLNVELTFSVPLNPFSPSLMAFLGPISTNSFLPTYYTNWSKVFSKIIWLRGSATIYSKPTAKLKPWRSLKTLTTGVYCFALHYKNLIFEYSISAVPPYPGLRRFPDGRDYNQWTGDDSKALMKVRQPWFRTVELRFL